MVLPGGGGGGLGGGGGGIAALDELFESVGAPIYKKIVFLPCRICTGELFVSRA